MSAHFLTVQSDITPSASVASIKVFLETIKAPGSDQFRPHSRSNRQHYILLGAEIQLHTGKFADFLASCYCTSYIYV